MHRVLKTDQLFSHSLEDLRLFCMMYNSWLHGSVTVQIRFAAKTWKSQLNTSIANVFDTALAGHWLPYIQCNKISPHMEVRVNKPQISELGFREPNIEA